MSVQVMVNGIPGNMGRIVAETCVARGLELVPYSLTGEIMHWRSACQVSEHDLH